VSLDLFLEAAGTFDRESIETALAASGIGEEATLVTPDGGRASVSLDSDTLGFFIQTLTPEIAAIVFDVARRTRLAILPVDGTPTAIVVGDFEIDEELEPVSLHSSRGVYEALKRSENLRAARTS
jgi:hypothetical protein